MYIYFVAKEDLYRCAAPLLSKTEPVDLQQYSLKETKCLKQDISVKKPEGCCCTSVLRDQ